MAEHTKRNHLPVEDEVFRRIQQDQAKQVGDLIQVAVDRKLGELAVAQAVVRRAAERLAKGEIEPTFREAVAAARLLERYDRIRFERDQLRRERDEAQRALFRILVLVKRLMPARSWSVLGGQVDAEPALRAFWPTPAG